MDRQRQHGPGGYRPSTRVRRLPAANLAERSQWRSRRRGWVAGGVGRNQRLCDTWPRAQVIASPCCVRAGVASASREETAANTTMVVGRCDAAVARSGAIGCPDQAAHEAIHRTPGPTACWWSVLACSHAAGGAAIEQSRKRTCNTTMAWLQCRHTKVVAGEADCASADFSASGGATGNNTKQHTRQRQVGPSIAVGQQAAMPDPVEGGPAADRRHR